MRRRVRTFLVLALCILLSACTSTHNTQDNDDSYLNGLDQGHEDVFLNLWQAGDGTEIFLESGKAWVTDQFSISITQGENKWGKTIHINLSTSTLTMAECFEDQRMLFNVFSCDGSQFEGLLTDDLFYMSAVLEEDGEHTAQATIGIYDSTKLVAILVAVDGRIYRAVYYIS